MKPYSTALAEFSIVLKWMMQSTGTPTGLTSSIFNRMEPFYYFFKSKDPPLAQWPLVVRVFDSLWGQQFLAEHD